MKRVIEELALREEVRKFASENDLMGRSGELDREPAFPWKEFSALGKKGWLGPRVGASFGGSGWSFTKEAALIEELARNGGSVFAKLALQPDFSSALRHGSTHMVDRWYRPLFKGETLVGNQVTEPQAGSDARALSSRVEHITDGSGERWVLSGTKSGIAFAADAKAAIVYAKTSMTDEKDPVSAFLVPQDLKGITVELHQDMGERWMRRGTVNYDRITLPAGSMIGAEGEGFKYLLSELTEERALLSVIYLALAEASLEEAIGYARARKIFGSPLSSYEAVSFTLVEDEARLAATRLYVMEVLGALERGEKVTGGAAMAKWMSNSTALKVLDHVIQFHGGKGYSSELPHEQRYRDVRSGAIAHGSNETLKMVAARELFPR